MSNNNDVAVVVPCFNEAGAVGKVIKDLKSDFVNIVCVDDGSKDDTANEVVRNGGYLLQHPINLGQGAAIQTGIDYAISREDIKYIATFDADGQHRKEDLIKMVNILRDTDTDIVLGSRFLGNAVGLSRVRQITLKLGVIFNYLITGLKLTDAHNGIRVFTKDTGNKVEITFNGMAHATEIIEIISRKKLRYIEVPVEIIYSDYSLSKGQSSINAINIVADVIGKKFTK